MLSELNSNFLSRLRYEYAETIPDYIAAELLTNYVRFNFTRVTEETTFLIIRITAGNPFNIGSIIRSAYPGKDLTTLTGVLKILEFETLDDRGEIKSTWMKYLSIVFPNIVEINIKKTVLYLSKHRAREWTRDELRKKLNLEMPEDELVAKLNILVAAGIIKPGTSDVHYRGKNDSIFEKVFRGVFGEGIPGYDGSPKVIREEYNQALKKERKRYNLLPMGSELYRKSPPVSSQKYS